MSWCEASEKSASRRKNFGIFWRRKKIRYATMDLNHQAGCTLRRYALVELRHMRFLGPAGIGLHLTSVALCARTGSYEGPKRE